MKSIFLLVAVAGAASDAPNCQSDENTMMQGLNTMRKVKKTAAGSKDAKAMLKEMREMANSLVEDSDSTTSEDVLDTLDASQAQITAVREATLQQVANAQQQLIDASGGFQACTTEELTGLQESVEQRAAAVESCQSTLAQKRTAETRQCATAEDCLCDEARVRTTDQEALCTAVTETYEAVFCEQHHVCTRSQQCHSLEAEVYQRLLANVQAEMGFIVEEYRAAEQAICLNGLSREAMTPPRTPIDKAAMQACLGDVDVSALSISFPALPAEPAACPAHAHGDPPCVVSLLSGNAACPQCTCELSRPDGPWSHAGSGCGSAFDDNLRWGPGSGVHVTSATLTLTFPAPVSIDHIDLHHTPYYTRYNPNFDIETFYDGAWTVQGSGNDFPIASDGDMEPVLGFQFAAPVLATQVRLISRGHVRVQELQVFGRLA